jgi:hypothetical protein
MSPARRRLIALGVAAFLLATAPALADRPEDQPARGDAPAHPWPPDERAAPRPFGVSGASGGWWLGSAGIALALALFGGLSVASRRFLPRGGMGTALVVVGWAGLSPRHTVYLLRVGDRVLIVGAGAQGPPALLGEVDDPDELGRLLARSPSRRDPDPGARGLDLRIGDEP